MSTTDDDFLTPAEVAEALDVHISRVYRLDSRLQPTITTTSGGYVRRRYDPRRVDQYLAARAERVAHETNFRRNWGDE